MGKARCSWFRLQLLATLLLLFMATVADAATVSGTVTNNSGKTGRIYIAGQWSGGGDAGWGVSIPSGATTYAIRGVQDGTYTVRAFIDTQSSGTQFANDPVGTSAQFNVSGGTNVSFVDVTLNNPPAVPLQQPGNVTVVNGDGGVLVMWDPARDVNGRIIATSHQVYWSTGPNPGPSNTTGGGTSGNIPHSGDANAYFKAFPNNTQLYFAVTAKLGGSETAPVNANTGAQVVVGPKSGGTTISGTVTSSGATLGASTPLYIAVAGSTGAPQYVGLVAAPSASQAYSIPGVLPGNYGIYAIVDMNNNGIIDLGDLTNTSGNGAPVTVGSTAVTGANVALVGANAAITVQTEHAKQGTSEWYSLSLEVGENKKRPVNSAVSGPNITTTDMALNNRGTLEARPNLSTRPTLSPAPDTYSFALEYSDGTTTGASPLTAPVTGIVDSFATATSPVGYVPYPFSSGNFTWSAPASPPTPYTYSFWLNVPGFSDDGFYNMPSSTTSATYTAFTGYIDGNNYSWSVSVKDSLGNSARSDVNFTPTSNPVITGFTPTSGVPGTQVTITGLNFDTTPTKNTVNFNSSNLATVISATSTQLVVTVPAGAATGPISVFNQTSSKSGNSTAPFTVVTPITFSGTVKDSAGVNLSGATVTMVGSSITATTDASGNFTINIPGNTDSVLTISKTGYVTEYSGIINSPSNISGRIFTLYDAATLTGWGLQSGKGVLVGFVKSQTLNGSQNLAGAQVSITSSNPAATYTVLYDDGVLDKPVAGSATSATGRFYVLNVAAGATLTMTASKAGVTFTPRQLTAYPDSVTYSVIVGTDTQAPVVTSFSAQTPVNSLTVPITPLAATDNVGVAGYVITESNTPPGIGAAWSASAPASYTFTNSAAPDGSYTLYAWAADAAGNVSLPVSQTVVIDRIAPVTTANPAGGTQTVPINVTLTANEPATIYYTTNGAAPTTSSASFTDSVGNVAKGPIAISTTTTLQYFARDLAGNNGTIQTQVYSYGTPTTTSLAISGQPATYTGAASALTMTATVTSTTTPTGQVTFTVDGAAVATVPLTGGVASTTSSITFTGGAHAVVANYLGDSTVTPPFAASSGNSSFTVAKAAQTITVITPAPASAAYNTPFTVAASAPAGLITYSSGSPAICTNSGATFTMVSGTGNCVVQYDQIGDNNYNAAPQVTSSTTATQAAQASVTVTTPTTAYYGQTGLAAVAAGGSGTGAYTYSAGASTACSVNSATGALTITSGTGTCSVTATKLADTNYSISAVSAASTITISKASQTITFAALAPKNTIDPPFNLTATASSGLPVSYASSNTAVATVSGSTVTLVGVAGTAIITASQAGDANYLAATDVTQSLTVTVGQTITVTSAPATADFNSQFTVVASSNSGLTVAYSSGSPSICTNSGATFTMLTGTGTCIVQYDQAGNGIFDPAPRVTSSVTAAKIAQSAVTVAAPAGAIYSQTGLSAVASGGNGTGAYSYSSGTSTACSVNATTGALTITSGTGTCSITATRQGDTNYIDSSASTPGTVAISKASATVTLSALNQTYNGAALAATAVTSPAGLTVNTTYAGSSTAPANAGTYAVVATINDANYQGSATGNLVIARAAATVTLSNLTQTADGTPKGVTITTSPASLAVNVTYNTSAAIPTTAGSYNVVAAITDPNYQGSAAATLNVLSYGDIAGGTSGQFDNAVNIVDAYNYLLISLKLTPPPAYTGNLLLAPIVAGKPTAVPGSRSVNILDVRAMLEHVAGLW